MRTILTTEEAIKTSKRLKCQNKIIVLAGGCFDILHPGHIVFLKQAKEAGDILFVMLESDEKIRQLKGRNRPIHFQRERAIMLKSIRYVDYVIPLKNFSSNNSYDEFINELAPNIIAITENDPQIEHKKRQAKIGYGIIKVVTKYISHASTTRVADMLLKDL